jgi:hypothetical protein
VFDAFSNILALLYTHQVDGFEPVASIDDLAYFARQRMEFLKRLSSKKHGMDRRALAPVSRTRVRVGSQPRRGARPDQGVAKHR